ncbi:hypothetical protein AYL99_10321 [Fonsecaea erecta]|uniref:Clr5 domain-containing protein n=1 Tax=Fonsecaea erecta TaxID=1367422 RepID=A0A178Z6E3_9EURO|nr:hypothetical protein AYL99_10321 [Fonsecaea erecta]OAP55348.1 hypothetical protein AYL99_10321 [Fonsecaea erecta]
MATPSKISRSDWQEHQSTICRLYQDEGMHMKKLIEVMSRDFGFNASKAQYMRQFKVWGIQKNMKGDFWKDLSRVLKSMRLKIADLDVFFNERLIPESKLRKELPRRDLPTYTQTTARPQMPEGIFVRPKIRLPRILIISLPWYQICAQLEMAMSTPAMRGGRSPSPLPSAVLDVTDEWHGQEDNYCWMEDFPNFPREIARNQSCRPSIVGRPTVQKAIRDSNIVDAGIVSVLNPSEWCTSREGSANTMARIEAYIPRRSPEEIENIANQLINPDATTRMQVFMSFTALMLANNLLQMEEVNAFVIALDEIAGPSAFDVLSLRDDPSTRAIISEILFAAVRVDKSDLVKSAMKKGWDMNRISTGPESRTLIVEAVQWGRVRIVEILIDAGADIPTGRMVSPYPPDHLCLLHGHVAGLTTSEAYQLPGFYCQCEVEEARRECAISAAAFSRGADELLPLLLKSRVSVAAGPVLGDAIRHGACKETVDMLLRKGATANECVFEFQGNLTALGVAVESGDIEMVRLLLDYGANPNGPVTFGHEMLMREYPGAFRRSPLVIAAQHGDLDMIQVLVQCGADPNWSTWDILGESWREGFRYYDPVENIRDLVHLPLQAAALAENPATTECLLRNGADANRGYGIPPLSFAAYRGRNATVDLLIKSGAKINPDYTKACLLPPLEGAVYSGSESLVQQMISAGADLDRCSSGRCGTTALQRAAERGFGAIFDLLRSAGAKLDSSSTPNHATTILQGFVKRHDYERSLGLLRDGVSPNGKCKDDSSPLTAAILGGDVNLMSLLLEWDADPNDTYPLPAKYIRYNVKAHQFLHTRSLLTAVHCAAVVGNFDAVTRLCNAGADVNKPSGSEGDTQDLGGLTALHLAAASNHKSIVEFLIDQGADINVIYCQKDLPAISPIFASITNSDFEITKILLQHGADPYLGQLGNGEKQASEWRPGYDMVALEEACRNTDVQMVRLLISAGVSVHVGCPLYFTFETKRQAQVEREAEIMELLLANGADVNHRYDDTDTPLQAALTPPSCDQSQSARVTRLRCARRLIELGAEINAAPSSDGCGRTALQAAVVIGDVEFVQYLLSRGAEVNAPAAQVGGVTALQAAAIGGYLRIAQILLEHGAEIDADPSSYEGRRAIEGAAERGRIDMVKLLLDNYNGPRPFSKVCESAMEFAKRQNQWYMMEFLRSYTPPTSAKQ